ncbi:MAG: LamG domain-containing protein [Armatimonadetes bacterium]|nr:LamG domain-containing protein [Armatimonadota bacterium]
MRYGSKHRPVGRRGNQGAALLLSLLLLALAERGWAGEARPPWQTHYTGAEATGEHVIALWQFQPGQETRDASGNGHDLTLRGQARFTTDGPFGGCLESFAAGAENDKPQGALAANAPDLSPAGAFTLELWFSAKPELEQHPNVFLVDKKYFNYVKAVPEANWDYCLCLVRTGEGRRRLDAHLGFGTDSAVCTSREFPVIPGRWIHLAFTYDGAGTGRFFINGRPAGKTILQGRGPVTPGRYGVVLGDRYGSIHSGFPGYLAQVRLCRGIVPTFSGGLELELGAGRTAFVRQEKRAAVPLTVSNDTGRSLEPARLQARLAGKARTFRAPGLAPGKSHTLSFPVDTTLRPGAYPLRATVTAAAGDGRQFTATTALAVTIAPRPLPHQMPVVNWGTGDLKQVKALGFTHQLIGWDDDYGRVWEAGRPLAALPDAAARNARLLDDYLAQGLSALIYLYPGRWSGLKSHVPRVDRDGKPREGDNVCVAFPEVQRHAYNVGASVARALGDFPALAGSLIHSEVRDDTDLCFHPHDLEACRRATGAAVPPEVQGRYGVRFSVIPDFPPWQVVPDDHPLLRYYRWFWKEGDGWNPLHTRVHQGLKSTGRRDWWTFFDPAVRVPSLWGSGGGVDVISQWTYSYPDPIKIGQATDELFAMAAGRPGQRVMKMTQVIWYRSGTAPKLPEDEAKRASWERKIPDAQFITIAPDHLREAFWSKLSRPIQGIMYHGWESLTDTGRAVSYRYTHPQTQRVLAELVRTVVRPLGPTLLQVPDRPSDFGVLESFTSQIFAGRGTHGWSQGWEADLHLILQWAQIQPKVLYEETILRDGLEGCRVLALPFCDVLPEGVARRIAAFQRAGGLLIADEYLTPALTPDIVVPSYQRTGKAREDKRVLQARAASLRRELDPFYTRYGESANPDVVVRFRRYRHCDYLFAVNDRRTFGDYVGHHGLAMEKGLPTTAALTVRRPAGHVYDLVAHRPVPVRAAGGALRFTARFGPGDGRLFLIAPTPIRGVRVAAPARASRGGAVRVEVTVVDPRGAAVPAVVPVQVEVLDPRQRPAEPSGYYGAKDGKLSFTLDLAPNDLPGRWVIRARELASGSSGARAFTVAR